MRLMMRRERDRWDMVFVDGAEGALSELARAPFDVVVSDMRMPGMDGAALLAEVRARTPATVRVMLTGYADSASIVRALPSVHQLFAKPCAPASLRAMLDRCLRLDALGGDASILAAVGSLDQLPSPPLVYQQLQELSARGNAGVLEVTEIISGDPACAARVLQLANSSYFGDGTTIHSVARAVSCLGAEHMQILVLGAALTRDEATTYDTDTRREHARRIRASIADPARQDIAIAAALLRDIGSDVLSMRLGRAYTQLLDTGRPLVEVEREHLGLTHADVGAALLAIWGLPDAIVDAVRFHHAPDAAPDALRDVVLAIADE